MDGADGPTRRSGRARVVSQRVAVVTEDALAAARAARLAALEADDGGDAAAAAAEGGATDDDEFVPDDADYGDDDSDAEDGQAVKKARTAPTLVPGAPLPRRRGAGAGAGGGATKTRAARAERRGPKPLSDIIDEDGLTRGAVPPPNWLTASVGPPTAAPRRWCSMCGLPARYTCPRCRSRTCGRRCGNAHAETRCLKFVS